jgi:hypothetical protein
MPLGVEDADNLALNGAKNWVWSFILARGSSRLAFILWPTASRRRSVFSTQRRKGAETQLDMLDAVNQEIVWKTVVTHLLVLRTEVQRILGTSSRG